MGEVGQSENDKAQPFFREIKEGDQLIATIYLEEDYEIGRGENKTIRGPAWLVGFPGDEKRYFLGSAGENAIARARTDSTWVSQSGAFAAIQSEKSWNETIAQSNGHDQSEASHTSTDANPHQYTIEAVPFAESLEGFLMTMQFTRFVAQRESFSDTERSFLVLDALARASKALEEFHGARTNAIIGLVHGDVGQMGHLNNIIFSVADFSEESTPAVLIDNSHVEQATLIRSQEAEWNIFAHSVDYLLQNTNLRDLIPQELNDAYINGHLEFFDSKTIGHFARAKLREVAEQSQISLPEASAQIRHRYLLQHWQKMVAEQGKSGTALPRQHWEAIHAQIKAEDKILHATTQILPAIQPPEE